MSYQTRLQTRLAQAQSSSPARTTRTETRRSSAPSHQGPRPQRPQSLPFKNQRRVVVQPVKHVVQSAKRPRIEREKEDDRKGQIMDLDEECDGGSEPDQAAKALVQRSRLFLIDAHILRLQLERKVLANQLDIYTYPVLSLPNEITCEIFIHAIDRPSPGAGYPAPMVLAQVCRHWRDIALSLPRLWRTISLKLCRDTLNQRLIMAKTWIERSGVYPLSISFSHGSAAPGTVISSRIFEEFLLELKDHFSRLQYLDVGVTLMGSAIGLVKYPMPRLTHLTLWIDRIYTLLSSVMVIPPESVPLLRSIELRHCDFFSIESFAFPWKQITTLKCDHIDYSHLRGILKETPVLSHCVVSHMKRNLIVNDETSLITLPHLKSLIFSHYAPNEIPISGIFPISTMTLPALRILEIPETYLRRPSFDDLLALVSRSGCNIEELRVVDLTHSSTQDYMHRFPSIPSISFPRQLSDIYI